MLLPALLLHVAAKNASAIFLEKLEDVPAPALPEVRRRAQDKRLYTATEFKAHYGVEVGLDKWEKSLTCNEYNWTPSPVATIGNIFWPREAPRRHVVRADGTIEMEDSPPNSRPAVDLLSRLLRVRQAEIVSRRGTGVGEPCDPDAWDITVAEDGVDIDIHRTLTVAEYTSALQCWRRQWQDRVALTVEQERKRQCMGAGKFYKQMRTTFWAYVKIWMGEPQVAKFIIRYGVGPSGTAFLDGGVVCSITGLQRIWG